MTRDLPAAALAWQWKSGDATASTSAGVGSDRGVPAAP